MKKEKEIKSKIDSFIEKTVDFLFSNRSLKSILLIFIIGLLFRYVAASNVDPVADDTVHGPHAAGIIKSGVIGRIWQSLLWS